MNVARENQVLALGGSTSLLEKLRGRLGERGYQFDVARDPGDCAQRFTQHGADLLLLMLPFPGGGSADLIRRLREIDPAATLIVTGVDNEIRSAKEAFELSVFEHVEDPERDFSELLAAIGGSLGSRRGDVQLRYLKQREATTSTWDHLVGSSSEMAEVVSTVRRVSERTTRGAPPLILLRGETGTGKGLLAKCIHYNGVRRNQAFVEVNCAAIPPSLIESELFGYEKGAFTDARSSKAGLFETAHQGTLFLDEIGSLPLDVQAKLLVAIEERNIRRLGATRSTQVNLQIIAAAHTDLPERVRKGSFRSDLYHRLNVVSVTLPPLRRRGSDIVMLARSFLDKLCRDYGMDAMELSPDAVTYMLSYGWPGNVRELRNQMERIVLLSADGLVGAGDFDRPSLLPPASDRSPPSVNAPISFRPSQTRTKARFNLEIPDDGIGLDEVEHELIKIALDRFDGNVSRAARFLKVSRQTLIYRVKKHGFESTG